MVFVCYGGCARLGGVNSPRTELCVRRRCVSDVNANITCVLCYDAVLLAGSRGVRGTQVSSPLLCVVHRGPSGMYAACLVNAKFAFYLFASQADVRRRAQGSPARILRRGSESTHTPYTLSGHTSLYYDNDGVYFARHAFLPHVLRRGGTLARAETEGETCRDSRA